MFTLRQYLAGLFLMLALTMASAGTCRLAPLPINPIASGRNDIYIGESAVIDVQFKNEKREGIVEVFPEPPLIIRNRELNTACSIDGGVWVRKSVFVSNDDRVVVTQEFSGSNDFLNFYEVESCKKIAEIDVSNSSWEVQGTDIIVAKKKVVNRHGRGKLFYHLNESCKPVIGNKNRTPNSGKASKTIRSNKMGD